MKEVFSVDLTPQGYRQELLLPEDFPRSNDAFLRSIFQRCWEKRPLQGQLINQRMEHQENKYVVMTDAIFRKESVTSIHQESFYALMPFLTQSFHNKFNCTIAATSLPEYTTKPKHDVIAKIGVELEGGWSHSFDCIKGDGSVSGMRDASYTGEIPFPPFHPRDFPWVEDISLPAFQTIRRGTVGSFTSMYPNYVNHTCGMHVHVSFPSKGMYAAFVDARFTPWLVRGLTRWGEIGHIKSKAFYSRLAGGHNFCMNIYDPEGQLQGNGQRYAIVNYCYSRYNTMEIRVLPMFKEVRFAIRAIKALVKLINLWGSEFGPVDGPVRLSSFTEEEVNKKLTTKLVFPMEFKEFGSVTTKDYPFPLI